MLGVVPANHLGSESKYSLVLVKYDNVHGIEALLRHLDRLIVGVSRDLRDDSWGYVPRSLFWREDLDRDGERGFELCSSFIEGPPRRLLGLRVADSLTGNLPEAKSADMFTLVKDSIIRASRLGKKVMAHQGKLIHGFEEAGYKGSLNIKRSDLYSPKGALWDLLEKMGGDEIENDWIYEWNGMYDGVFYDIAMKFPGAYHIGNSLHYQDLEWYEALEDRELKDEALRNKAIIEGLISDDESSNDCWKRWKSHEICYHDYDEGEYENETHEEGHELCGIKTREVSVCQIKRYKMIKYSFNNDEEYVAVKEDEYNDLTSTSEEACRAYQEIFRMMDEDGWF
ncbi:hypothetical protein Tco_1032424 [Tanacetum coccineum]|uniref:Uncharacterized protein n=1 Tax=Tanacetum coccineum TaxID=301880 RepID=A0ABQ5GBT7_9ASTR